MDGAGPGVQGFFKHSCKLVILTSGPLSLFSIPFVNLKKKLEVEAEALLVFVLFLTICMIVLMGFVILNIKKETKESKEEARMFFSEMIKFISLMRKMHPDGEEKESN